MVYYSLDCKALRLGARLPNWPDMNNFDGLHFELMDLKVDGHRFHFGRKFKRWYELVVNEASVAVKEEDLVKYGKGRIPGKPFTKRQAMHAIHWRSRLLPN